MLGEDSGEKLEVLGIEPVEAEHDRPVVDHVDPRDVLVALQGDDARNLGIHDGAPGEGHVARGQGSAVGPQEARTQPVGDRHAPALAVPADVAVVRRRNAGRQVGQELKIGRLADEPGKEQAVDLGGRLLGVEVGCEVGRGLPIAHHQRASLALGRLRLIPDRRLERAGQDRLGNDRRMAAASDQGDRRQQARQPGSRFHAARSCRGSSSACAGTRSR